MTQTNTAPAQEPTLAQLVDEFAGLYNRLAADIDRMDALKKQLGEFANAAPTGAEVTLSGAAYAIDYGVPAQKSECLLSPQQVVEQHGAWGALTVSLTEAKKLLPSAAFVISQGSRRLKRVRPLSPA